VINESRLTVNVMQIVSKIHALAATYRAVNDLLQNRLKSRNVHSEIVFSLSPNNNVRSSLASSSPFRSPPFCFFRPFPNSRFLYQFFFFTVSYDLLSLFLNAHCPASSLSPIPTPNPSPTPSYLPLNIPRRSPNPSAASA
jgi:hypothetical protein